MLKELYSLEKGIVELETAYAQDTQHFGNIYEGWDRSRMMLGPPPKSPFNLFISCISFYCSANLTSFPSKNDDTPIWVCKFCA